MPAAIFNLSFCIRCSFPTSYMAISRTPESGYEFKLYTCLEFFRSGIELVNCSRRQLSHVWLWRSDALYLGIQKTTNWSLPFVVAVVVLFSKVNCSSSSIFNPRGSITWCHVPYGSGPPCQISCKTIVVITNMNLTLCISNIWYLSNLNHIRRGT